MGVEEREIGREVTTAIHVSLLVIQQLCHASRCRPIKSFASRRRFIVSRPLSFRQVHKPVSLSNDPAAKILMEGAPSPSILFSFSFSFQSSLVGTYVKKFVIRIVVVLVVSRSLFRSVAMGFTYIQVTAVSPRSSFPLFRSKIQSNLSASRTHSSPQDKFLT